MKVMQKVRLLEVPMLMLEAAYELLVAHLVAPLNRYDLGNDYLALVVIDPLDHLQKQIEIENISFITINLKLTFVWLEKRLCRKWMRRRTLCCCSYRGTICSSCYNGR